MHDAARLLLRFDHGHAFGGGVRHGLFAVDVFSGGSSVNDDALVPVVGNGGDDAVDVLAIEEFLIFAGDGEIGLAGDFAGELMTAIPEIGGADALDAGKRGGGGEEAGTLHADADDSEAHLVARRNVRGTRRNRIGIGEEFWSDGGGACESGGAS